MGGGDMDNPLSSWLRTTFLLHWIISALLGVPLFLVPGRTLTILGWVPQWVQLPESELSIPGQTFVDAAITRLLGAALLALAFSSFRGWRVKQWGEVEILIQMEAIFCVTGTVAFLAGFALMERPTPVIGYILTLILAVFAVAWGLALRRK
jgi:phosphatidylserine synthase